MRFCRATAFNFFTLKVKEAFVTILDNPRVANSVGFSVPSIFSDSHSKLRISKTIVRDLYKITRAIITGITRPGLTVESDDVSFVHGGRSSKYLDVIGGGGV